MTTNRTYFELAKLETFEERYQYLSLRGIVGDSTFGHERFTNQAFYTSSAWRRARNVVMIRDNGCDLGIPGREINSTVYIHHINPLTPNDIRYNRSCLVDSDNLITVSHRTHNAIHYGDESQLETDPVERKPNDHIFW